MSISYWGVDHGPEEISKGDLEDRHYLRRTPEFNTRGQNIKSGAVGGAIGGSTLGVSALTAPKGQRGKVAGILAAGGAAGGAVLGGVGGAVQRTRYSYGAGEQRSALETLHSNRKAYKAGAISKPKYKKTKTAAQNKYYDAPYKRARYGD